MTHSTRSPYNKHTLRVLLLCCGFAAANAAAEVTKAIEDARDISGEASLAQLAEVEKLAAATVPDQIAPAAPPPAPAPITPELVKAQNVVPQGGRTITFQRLAGPPPRPPSPPTNLPLTEGLSDESQEPEKPNINLFISSTVYDRKFTEMRWFKNEQEYKVFINFDFTLFRSVTRVEGEKSIYSLIMGIGESSLEDEIQREEHLQKNGLILDERHKLPDTKLFTKEISIIPAPGNPPDLADTNLFKALPELIAFYQNNENDLRWKQAVQKAENAARKRWQDAQPPKQPQNVVIPFWPVKSRLFPAENQK